MKPSVNYGVHLAHSLAPVLSLSLFSHCLD